ncbi:MAG: hypothetical protein Q9220_005070 [cf. Caloplaca sp. 1 TL-2023]
MPTPRPLTPKRPKLSLQTSSLPLLPPNAQSRTALAAPSSAVDSPTTYRNTTRNAFEVPPSTPVSANPGKDEASTELGQVQRPSPQTTSSTSSISTISSSSSSPLTHSTPYMLGLGARSILRNSPLPKRHITTMSNRPPKRMFQPIKRVSFPDEFIEMIPSPILHNVDSPVVDMAIQASPLRPQTEAIGTQTLKELDNEQPASPRGRPRRRGRDWIFRPTNDEASPTLPNDQQSCSPASVIAPEESSSWSRAPEVHSEIENKPESIS